MTLITLSPEELKQLISESVKEVLASSSKEEANMRLHTCKETAKQLHVTLPTLKLYTDKGLINGFYVGKRILYKQADIESALKSIKKYAVKN